MREAADIGVAVGYFPFKEVELVETLLGFAGVELDFSFGFPYFPCVALFGLFYLGCGARFCLVLFFLFGCLLFIGACASLFRSCPCGFLLLFLREDRLGHLAAEQGGNKYYDT